MMESIKRSIMLLKTNHSLTSSLNKFLFFSIFFIYLISFSYGLVMKDTQSYFMRVSEKYIYEEGDGYSRSDLDKLRDNLKLKEESLEYRGIDIDSSSIVIDSHARVVSNKSSIGRIELIASDDLGYASLRFYTDIKWEWQKERSDNGIYISKASYELLGKPESIDICIDDEDIYVNAVIDGVYTFDFNKKYLLYSDSAEEMNFECILMSSEFFERAIGDEEKYYVHNFYTANKEIDNDASIVITNILDNPEMPYIDNESTRFIINGIEDSITKLVIVTIATALLLCFFMITKYYSECERDLKTFRIFYLEKKELSFMSFFSIFYLVMKSFIITTVLFLLLKLIFYLIFSYNISVFTPSIFLFVGIIIIFTGIVSSIRVLRMQIR